MDYKDIVIIEFVKTFLTNIYAYYCFTKITNTTENKIPKKIFLVIANMLILLCYVPINVKYNSFFVFTIMWFVYTFLLSKITNHKYSYSMIVSIVSYAILAISHTIAIIVQFVPYKILEKLLHFDNIYISLIMIELIQFLLIYGFFRIKRFRNGFSFFNNKLNHEIAEIIILNISATVIIIYCLFKIGSDETTMNLFAITVVLAYTMFLSIHKMLTMYYKQKLLTDTMEEYKKELSDKQKEIDILKADKKNVSKITHEFYNRQKALELLVASNMNTDNIDKENVSQNVLNIIESLTNEYSERFEEVKELPKLEETEIAELDTMFKYMQDECHKNNIKFKLKVIGNIHYLVNNLISKNKLETLIGDHVRDAINAVNLINADNKEILAVLGVKNKKYEFSVYDTRCRF